MSRLKSGIITLLAGTLLFYVLYLTGNYSIRTFRVFEGILAAFGYVESIYILYRWLREPSPPEIPSGTDGNEMDPVRSGDTIPDSWINPFKKENKHERKKEEKTEADNTQHI